jgi:uncharacterized protein (DUF427 family)
MTKRTVLAASADHPITIERNLRRVRVYDGRNLIADTTGALTLTEASYAPVHYIPRRDVRMSRLRRADHVTFCPYKGEATYFDIVALGEEGANAVWTYERPHPGVHQIAGLLAFSPSVTRITEDEQ